MLSFAEIVCALAHFFGYVLLAIFAYVDGHGHCSSYVLIAVAAAIELLVVIARLRLGHRLNKCGLAAED